MTNFSERIRTASLYTTDGQRKYLTERERQAFKKQAEQIDARKRDFCLMLYYTGCRISEALELCPQNILSADRGVIFRCLKRRSDTVFRALPLPPPYLNSLHSLCKKIPAGERIWKMSRKTAYRLIKRVMRDAGIHGAHSTPKGLRHGFGIACAQANIPLPTISKWMGHTSIQTTLIYLNAVGQEERNLAKRLW